MYNCFKVSNDTDGVVFSSDKDVYMIRSSDRKTVNESLNIVNLYSDCTFTEKLHRHIDSIQFDEFIKEKEFENIPIEFQVVFLQKHANFVPEIRNVDNDEIHVSYIEHEFFTHRENICKNKKLFYHIDAHEDHFENDHHFYLDTGDEAYDVYSRYRINVVINIPIKYYYETKNKRKNISAFYGSEIPDEKIIVKDKILTQGKIIDDKDYCSKFIDGTEDCCTDDFSPYRKIYEHSEEDPDNPRKFPDYFDINYNRHSVYVPPSNIRYERNTEKGVYATINLIKVVDDHKQHIQSAMNDIDKLYNSENIKTVINNICNSPSEVLDVKWCDSDDGY